MWQECHLHSRVSEAIDIIKFHSKARSAADSVCVSVNTIFIGGDALTMDVKVSKAALWKRQFTKYGLSQLKQHLMRRGNC